MAWRPAVSRHGLARLSCPCRIRDRSRRPGSWPPGARRARGGPMPERSSYRVVIVGAGFGGIGMAVALKQAGVEDFLVLDRGAGIGGTWRDNTYPGLACDVPSNLYSFS